MKQDKSEANNSNLIFLNFNYTNTISNFLPIFCHNYRNVFENLPEEIQIHGKVGDNENPIIFGFGDEMDSNYKLLEQLNNNRYLDYMKSFGYFKTNRYKKLEAAINSAPFEVYVMGHSCGLSDRVMLNMIFEHDNCRAIKIFYHKKDNDTDNFTETTQNISRHFNDKRLMRHLVLSKVSSKPLIQVH